MAKTFIGNIKGPQGDPGVKGDPGAKGQRGSRWVTGTAITGIETAGIVFPETGIADSLAGDHYLNTDTNNVYRCTLDGDAETATWAFAGNISASIDTDATLSIEGMAADAKAVGAAIEDMGTAVITDIPSMEEYEALSDAEKMNGALYSVEVGNDVEYSADNVPYDNTKTGLAARDVQDAIDEVKSDVDEVSDVADEALGVAKGRNRARVFNTTDDMNTWLSDEANAGVAIVGDNIYIVDLGVPDWWISEVLTEADPDTGFYYKIAQLETQKVDLTTIEAEIDEIQSDLSKKSTVTITTKTGTVTLSNGHAVVDLGIVDGYIIDVTAFNATNAIVIPTCSVQSNRHLRFLNCYGSEFNTMNISYTAYILKIV